MNTMTPTPSILSAANEASRWLTLSEAAKSLPTVYGKKIHTATLWRWCRKGIRGVRLDYRRVGRTIVVSADHLAAFFAALAQQDSARPADAEPPLRRRSRRRRDQQRNRHEHQQAIQALIDAGILKPDKPQGVSQ